MNSSGSLIERLKDSDVLTDRVSLVAAADTELNQAVTNHKLSSAQATKIEAALPGRIAKLVNHTF